MPFHGSSATSFETAAEWSVMPGNPTQTRFPVARRLFPVSKRPCLFPTTLRITVSEALYQNRRSIQDN